MAVVKLTTDNFEQEVLQAQQPVLVDFYADWCGPCKMVAPVLEELSMEYEGQINFVKVNVDQEGDLAGEYGVMSIPNLVLMKDGQVVKQVVGYQPKPAIKALIDTVL
ncbi:thioredoxin [Traorella massiliensis]|uniref:thioredoxin n=1 Tax=Traorella massiliensis TaxID=1903263 RepID=UPI00248DB0B8|nr:thioredoxin [Traorella massiliensis]